MPRLRPGDRPLALDLSLSPDQMPQLRRRAHGFHLGVDAWLALIAEFQQIRLLVSRATLAELVAHLDVRSGHMVLSVAPELRGWQRVIDGRTAAPAPDELPTVFLPLRVLAPVKPEARAAWVSALFETSDAEVGEALRLERAAVREGMTMQTWALGALAQPLLHLRPLSEA
jgi:hypothetical protein